MSLPGPTPPDSPFTVSPLGQPVGLPVVGWKPPPWPPRVVLEGRYCRMLPLSVERDGEALDAQLRVGAPESFWTYLPYGPFLSREEFRAWLAVQEKETDPLFFTLIDRHSDKVVGLSSYLRINPPAGSVEVGHVLFSPAMQRSTVATEAMYLLMKQAFALGYRRYEWKCDALNAKSRAAATRLGFQFEGIFRQALVYKGRNRDTAWFSILDSEWPKIEARLNRWLDPENFDAQGQQRRRLHDMGS